MADWDVVKQEPISPGTAPPPAVGGDWAVKSQEEQPGIAASLFRGFLHGMGDMVTGGAQIGARMGEVPAVGSMGILEMPGGAARVDAAAQQRARQYGQSPGVQAHPIASGIGRVGGNIAATAPLAALPGAAASIPGRMGMGAASGALGAALAPVEGGDYWKEKGKQVLAGLGVGGALGGAGRAIGPPLSAAAQDVVSKFPYVAGIIRGTAMRTPDNFNRAVVNQALAPIGQQVPRNLKAGHGLIEFAYDKLQDAYNKVLPKTSMLADPDFEAKIGALKQSANLMPPSQEKQFNSIVEAWVDKPLKDGALDGKQFNKTISQLGTKINAYIGSTDGGQRELADHLNGVREEMLDALERQNPDVANELKNLRTSYAMYARVRAAANRRTDSEGIFTPADLAQSIHTGDKSAGKQQWATGGAMMQAMAEATKGPMSAPKINRVLTEILGSAIGGSLGFAAGGPMGAATGTTAGTIAGLAGPQIARGMVRATQNPMARAAGAGVSAMAPGAGVAAARAVSKPAERLKAQQKVSQLQRDLYAAKRRGDLAEVKKLTGDLAEADAIYRRLRPQS